jgi:hypothetical protein
VVFIIVNCMAGSFVPRHTASILKSWAEAQSVPLGLDIKTTLKVWFFHAFYIKWLYCKLKNV